MALPDGTKIPLEVIAARWTKIFGELVTIDQLRLWSEDGLLHISGHYRSGYREGSRKRTLIRENWIAPEERDRFENEHAAGTQPETVQKNHTRSDAIKTSMNAYLAECKANNKNPELDECWRFTAERSGIEENHNGNLVYPILGGKEVREIDRKHFSERFKTLLSNR